MTLTSPTHSCAPDPSLHPLARIRAARCWSQQYLARLIAAQARAQGIGIAAERQKVWRWEHRGVTPDRLTQACLANLLRVPHAELAAHPWPAWLPSAEPPACQQEIQALRRELAEAREQLAVLRPRAAG